MPEPFVGTGRLTFTDRLRVKLAFRLLGRCMPSYNDELVSAHTELATALWRDGELVALESARRRKLSPGDDR